MDLSVLEIRYDLLQNHLYTLFFSLAGSKEHQTTGRRKNLNRSEELVEDDRDDELMMDTTLKIGLKNIKGCLVNCSSRTTMMERTPPKLASQFPSHSKQFRPSRIHLTDMGMNARLESTLPLAKAELG